MFGWFRRTTPDEVGRSGAWPRVRREHLAQEPACAACGRTKQLEVHHIQPYHEHPELELDAANLITLCADPCHLVHGHLLNWQRANPHVREDSARYLGRMHECGMIPEG